jgi:DNA-directed RNA polymerase specialized sigma24 family protein
MHTTCTVDAIGAGRIRSLVVDDAQSETTAQRFFDAVRRDEASARAALEPLWPMLEPVVRATIARHRTMLVRTGTDADDVVQHVALSLLRRPPTNEREQPPWIALKAWAITVTIRYLVDRTRRIRPSSDIELTDPAPLETRLDARTRVRRMLACAERLPPRYAEAFRLVLADPDLGALELAQKLGIMPRDPDLDESERERRARQNAWAVRSRTLRWLAECMREDDR